MKRRLLALSLLAALAVPADAGQQSDPCGDATPVVKVGPVQQAAPAERTAGFDIASLSVQDLKDGDTLAGVVVTLTLCGDIPAAPGFPSSSWQVGWALPGLPEGEDMCTGQLQVADYPNTSDGTVVREARISKSCNTVNSTPVLNGGSSTSSDAYTVTLPRQAWKAKGKTITWTLSRGADLGPAAEQVQAGVLLARPAATARDGRMITTFDTGGVRATGPGAEDSTGATQDHVVG